MNDQGQGQGEFASRTVVFQCGCVDTLHRKREQLQQVCRSYMNRPVRVETIDGEVVEGVLVQADRRHVYIAVRPNMPDFRVPYPGYPGLGPGFGPGFGPGPGPGYYPGPGFGPGPYPAPYPGYYPNPAGAILPLVLYELLVISLL
jgi:hypothetical protein